LHNQYLFLWLTKRTNQLLNTINTVYGYLRFFPVFFFFFYILISISCFVFVLLCNNVVLRFFFLLAYLCVVTVHIVYVRRREYYLQQSNCLLCFRKKTRWSENQNKSEKEKSDIVLPRFSIFVCLLFFLINIFSNTYIVIGISFKYWIIYS